ncbi:MAG: 3-phosphoglycerate dehydrogenase [Spirochaetes bacterium]|nr:3-phosphoglycerate dehydrogenase [Spirochaetota bacterium]
MKKILLATEKPFAKVAVDTIKDIFKKANYELILLENYKSKEEFLKDVENVDGLIVRSDIVDKEVIEKARNLKIIIRAGAGYDNIDLSEATSKNIIVMNTPGQNSNAVAELVFGLLITLIRKKYSGKSGFELRGKNIGIHAYGNVGKYVNLIAKGFGMKVYAFDPFADENKMKEDGVIKVNNAQDLYKNCSIISLHLPKTKETIKSINYDLFKLMPENAVLINTARTEIINEDDLIKIMEERKDFYYGADVEPEKKQIFLEKFGDRVLFTEKKMGAQTEEANINAGIAAANQMVDYFEKGITKFKVN